MGKVERLQQQIQKLSTEEWVELRDWFLKLDWESWDAQLENDIRAGRLDDLANQALSDHMTGKTIEI